MKNIGEVKLVLSGQKFDECLPVGGKVSLVMPNGSTIKFDILDVIDTEWYDETA